MSIEVEHLRQRAHTLSRALFLRLDEYVDDFPTGVPQGLIELFKDVARASDDVIEATSDVDRLALICHTLTSVAAHAMGLLDHANTAQTPRGLTKFLEKFRDRLQQNAVLLVTPFAGYNYTIANYFPFFDDLLRDSLVPEHIWETKCQLYSKGLNVVRFPRIERDNVLLHAIFGHEFGHPLADSFLKTEQSSEEYKREVTALNGKVSTAFASDLDARDDPVDRAKLQGELSSEATEMRARALEELISDAVAALLFGPSALFAATELLLTDGLDELPRAPEFYPSTRLRLRVMRDVLQNQGSLDALKALPVKPDLKAQLEAVTGYIQHLEALADSKADIAARATAPLVHIAYEWVEKSLPAAIQFAVDTIDDMAYAAALITDEVPESLKRLDLGIPPCEVGQFPNVRAVDWRTAILAGWLQKIYWCGQSKLEWNVRRDKIKDIQSLALKGIEDSLLRTEYLASYPDALKSKGTGK